MSKSPCATCRDPGYCCRGFTLSNIFPPGMPRAEVHRHTAEGTDPYGGDLTFQLVPQFRPLRISRRYIRRGQAKPNAVKWSFTCDWLGKDGRCTNYRRRPRLCKSFKPMSDMLCIEYEGSLKGHLTLYEGE